MYAPFLPLRLPRAVNAGKEIVVFVLDRRHMLFVMDLCLLQADSERGDVLPELHHILLQAEMWKTSHFVEQLNPDSILDLLSERTCGGVPFSEQLLYVHVEGGQVANGVLGVSSRNGTLISSNEWTQ